MSDMQENYEEYATFTTTDKDGNEIEMAVIDEFDFEHKSYVAAARIEGDTIDEEGLFIYRLRVGEDDFSVEKIDSAEEYQKVANAYLELS